MQKFTKKTAEKAGINKYMLIFLKILKPNGLSTKNLFNINWSVIDVPKKVAKNALYPLVLSVSTF